MVDNIGTLLKSIPENPGCYIYRDKDGKVIYVGKAKNLKKRVFQYFAPSIALSPRIEQMVTKIHDIEHHIVDTETEALILESSLIKKYKPKYNVLMKDDKSYTWIKITTKEEFPRVLRIRDKDRVEDGNTYFGPYPNSMAVNNILRTLRKLFPFRTCNYDIKEEEIINKSRKCLYFHVGLCPAPCDNLISKIQYNQNIRNIIKFLKGNNKEIIEEYKSQMNMYSKNEEYEKAKVLRDKVNDMLYITQKIMVTGKTDELSLKSEKYKKIQEGLDELFKSTNSQNKNNYRMECYDISNIQGTNPVSSMVVFENGIVKKSDYRKFKIRSMNTPNDFAMMRETLIRRLKYLLPENKATDKSFTSTPDLIIIDGGKGQLGVAYKVIQEYKLNINVVGLAKREELIFFPNNSIPLRLKRTSNAMYLIQRIRDEAHRFAVTFHKDLRSKAALISYLDNIKGIGPKTKEKLIREYKNIDNILSTNEEELTKIIGQKTAKLLKSNS